MIIRDAGSRCWLNPRRVLEGGRQKPLFELSIKAKNVFVIAIITKRVVDVVTEYTEIEVTQERLLRRPLPGHICRAWGSRLKHASRDSIEGIHRVMFCSASAGGKKFSTDVAVHHVA